MALTDNWKLMLVGYVLSYIGFTGANLLRFLPYGCHHKIEWIGYPLSVLL